MAPTKAANNTAINPMRLKCAASTSPPNKSITNATPNPAPLVTPKTPGLANGLRKVVCNNKPHTESEAPAKTAVNACGNRLAHKM